jgi:hypothetical protein
VDYGQFRTLLITNSRGQKRLIAYTYSTAQITGTSVVKIKLAQALEALAGQPQMGMVVVISMVLNNDKEDSEKLVGTANKLFSETLQGYFHAN